MIADFGIKAKKVASMIAFPFDGIQETAKVGGKLWGNQVTRIKNMGTYFEVFFDSEKGGGSLWVNKPDLVMWENIVEKEHEEELDEMLKD